MQHPESIYEFIKQEETRYETDEVRVYDNVTWNMRNHIQLVLSLRDGYYTTGENNWLRPFKKVIEPILNTAFSLEDIELKDITLFVSNQANRVLSFFAKKYHDEVYIKKHDLDTLIDRAEEESQTLGGTLVFKGKDVPEVLKLKRIAFCDQTDILGGPIGFKYNFSPSKLRKMSEVGWGDEKNGANITLNELITLATTDKEPAGMKGKKNETTGKNIEIYIVRGDLPEHYLEDNDNMEDYSYQVHVVGFYKNEKDKKVGVTLYRQEEDDSVLKFFTAKEVEDRALGKGYAEMVFHEQIWTNFLEIHKMNLLESASKVPLWTDDDGFVNRQQIRDMENLEITTIKEGRNIGQIPTAAPANIQLFEQSINSLFSNAQLVGSAQDPLLGRQSFAGQTFKGQERLVAQGKGPHETNKGKFAKFIEEIYRDWIIPEIMKEILKGPEFLASLTQDEMEWVADSLATKEVNRRIINEILDGELPDQEQLALLKEQIKQNFLKSGSKQKLKILKDEFKGAELGIEINVAGKQKDLGELTQKVLSIFQFVFSNPQGFQQVMQIPAMKGAFNDVLEFSGISQGNWATLMSSPQIAQMLPQGQQQPLAVAPQPTQ